MKSIISNIRISPKKLNLVAEMVRRKSVVEADSILRFTTKKAAEIVRKALASAVANAENNFKQDKETLFIDEIIVGKGPTLKRFNPVSRGRAHPILKRMSVITTKLGVKGEEPESKKKSKAEKAEAKTETAKEAKAVKAKAPKVASAKKSSVKVTSPKS